MEPAMTSVDAKASALSDARLAPLEEKSRGDEGGGHVAPAARPSWLTRKRAAFRASVWAPVATKLFGLTLGMLALSGIGIASILSGTGGVPVPLASMLGADVHAPWLTGGSRAAGDPVLSAAPSAPASSTASIAAGAASAAEPTTAAPASSSSASPSAASPGITSDGKVVLNLASAEDLRHLPGVGKKRADAILALRARLGHFKHVNDLLRVKGIGVRGLKKILPHVVLDAL